MSPDLVSSGYGEAFNALQYVDNPYALGAFLFLILVIALGRVRGIAPMFRYVGLLCLVFLVVLMMRGLLQTALDGIKNQTLLHLVRDEGPVNAGEGISVELIDVETLKGGKEGGHAFNKSVANAEDVLARVLEKAGVTNVTSDQLLAMKDEEWAGFLSSLEAKKAEMIKDIPFAMFAVFCDGRRLSELSEGYYFKGDAIIVSDQKCGPASLRLVNVYNTKHASSGEREAVNLSLERG